MKEILKSICKQESMSASALSNKLGCSRGFVKSVTYKAEDQILYKLLTLFPELNPYYLITGRGPVTVDLQSQSNIAKIGSSMADYKILYEQLKKMYDDISVVNSHLRDSTKKLMRQNETLIEQLNSLKVNA